jgi:RNA polymerase-binding transcription factor
MTKYDIDIFKAILEAKQADASRTLRSREGIIVEKSADDLDEIERAVSRDIAIQNLDRESRMLRDIRNSLQRIDQDKFGSCLHCEQEISRRRLEAVPWAQLCLRCQEAADRGDETVIDTVRTWLADAA